jgi:3-hydroxyacyl-[acyl-carrier-protein] dehydratase
LRWIWIDRFEEFESGRRAVAIKNVTLAEDHLHDHFPGFPVMPASLLIEGMAQTAGILVGEARQFAEKVILAKIKRAVFHQLVRPGQQIRHEAVIEQLTDSAASTSGRITCGDDLVGEVDIVFSHIDQNISGLDFPDENFVFTEEFMSLLKMYREHGSERVKL